MDRSALKRFFLNECSDSERPEIIAWLMNPQNDLLIKVWMMEQWNLIPENQEISSGDLDVQKIWNELSAKLFDQHAAGGQVSEYTNSEQEVHNLSYTGEKEAPDKIIRARLPNARRMMAAASIILLLGLFTYAFRQSVFYVRHQTGFGEVAELKLADGSLVVLNANSSLLVPRWGFANGDREVLLEGEAAFSVTHTAHNERFFVRTNGQLDVEVLGTEFSVYSRNQSNKVVLKRGVVKVQFKAARSQPVLMQPGDVISTENIGSTSVKHKQPVTNIIPWKDHRFVFDSTSLDEAAGYISAFFGNSIVVQGENIRRKTISGSFNAESAIELLMIISEIYDLNIDQNKNEIVLKEKSPPG